MFPNLKTYKVWSVTETMRGLESAGVQPTELGERICNVIDRDLAHEATTPAERQHARVVVLGFLSYNTLLATRPASRHHELGRPF